MFPMFEKFRACDRCADIRGEISRPLCRAVGHEGPREGIGFDEVHAMRVAVGVVEVGESRGYLQGDDEQMFLHVNSP